MDPDDLLIVARASGAFGLRGELRVHPFTANPELFGRTKQLFIGPKPQEAKPLTLESYRKQGKHLVFRTREIRSKEEADLQKGAWIYLPKDILPPLEQGEYYWFELIGACVQTVGGRDLGKVKSIMDLGPHDVMVVADGKNPEVLIPVIDQVVTTLDTKAGLVVVDPPEGLLEAQGAIDEEGGRG